MQKCRSALRCPLSRLVHDGDHGRTKLLATTFGLMWGVKWDRDGEEFMTQPPALVFMCDLPLPCLFLDPSTVTKVSYSCGLLPSFHRNCFCMCDRVASAELDVELDVVQVQGKEGRARVDSSLCQQQLPNEWLLY